MINKNFNSLKRSPNQIATELKIKHDTVSDYLNRELFKNSFSAPSFYKKLEEEKLKRKDEWGLESDLENIKNKSSIRYKIKLSIYYLLKICVKNFKELNRLGKKYSNTSPAKEAEKPTGLDIYGRMFMKLIVEEIDMLVFIKNRICSLVENNKPITNKDIAPNSIALLRKNFIFAGNESGKIYY